MATSSARPDDLDAFVRGSRAADDELRAHAARLRAAYADFQDGTRWGHLDASSLISGFGQYVDLNEADAKWVAQIAEAFRAAGGDGDLARLPDAAIAASLRSAGLTGGRTSVTFDDPVAYGFPPTSGFADDPVNTASGNLVLKVTDLPGFSRVYNSRSTMAGAFGPGWSSWADTRLHVRADGAEYSGPDGQRALFGRQGDGYGRVTGVPAEVVPDGDGLALRWFDGRTWRFDRAGRILTAGRDTFGWTGDRLTTAGSVTLAWTGDRITSASGSGRRVEFTYDDEGALIGAGDHTYELDDRSRMTAAVDADGVAAARTTFDADGRVVEQVSSFGRRTRYVYLPGRVTVVGETDTYVHDEHGRLLAVTDGHGNTLRRTYDEWGNPVTVTDRNGAVTTMRWDDRGHLLRRGPFEYRYDDAGRLVEVTGGGSVRYRYDGDERTPSEIVDGEGGVTRLDVRDGLVHRITDPDGVAVTFGFDGTRNLISATDALGNTARLERDAAGRVVAAVSPLGRRSTFRYDERGRLVERTDPGGGVWRSEYSPAGRLVAVTDPAGSRTETVHGAHGATETTIDPLGQRTTVAYDDVGNPARLILPDGAKWDFTFDTLSRLVATTDPSGATWLREFDADGNQVAAIDPMGTRRTATMDAENRVAALHDGLTGSTFEYDPLGRATGHVRPDGAAARCEYDRCGRRTVIEGPDGGRTRIEYTAGGRVRRTISPSGSVTTFDHDAAGRVSARIDGAGRRVGFRLDADGALVAVLDGDGEIAESYEYDDAGRLVARETPGNGRTRYEHDAAGRTTAITDATGGARRFEYDAAGRLIAAVDALGGRTGYERHPRGWITRITDPLGGVTELRHDESGRLVERVDPAGGRTRFEYDQAGRLIARADGSGRTVRWTYDTSGRVVTVSGGDGQRLTFRRDTLGRPVTVTEGAGRVDLAWDRAGRLISRVRDGLTVSHRYDPDGRRVAMVHPDGSESGYTYDAGGRLAAFTHPATGAVTIRRDALGRMIGADSAELRVTWEYTGKLRSAYTFESPAGRRAGRWTHDAAGRIVHDGERAYRYDAAGQLVAAGDATFAYDAAGRLVRDNGLACTYDAAGRLLARGGTRYEYDGAGRRVREGDRTYQWDALGRLSAVQEPGRRVELRHDPLGELAEVNGQRVLWDLGPFGAPIQVGDRQPPPGWLNPPGERDAWGAPASDEPGVGYRGELEFAGLVWLRNRVYQPGSRTFLSPDPLPAVPGTAFSGNPYHYAGNDPLGHADPLGLRPITDAELTAYRDEMSSGAFEDAGEWVGDNWEYIAAGAMIVGGIAVMATGVGGPIGAAMIGGALLSAGGSAGVQKLTTGEVDWGQVAVSGLIGGATGVVGAGAGLFVGSSARLAATSPFLRGAVTGGVSNVLGGGVNRGLHGQDVFDPAGLATDLLLGGAAGGLAGRLGAPLQTSNRPYQLANLPPNTLGQTDEFGRIFIRPGQTPAGFAETLRHETVHSILTPKNDFLRKITLGAYDKSALWRYSEEAAAESYGTLNPFKGLAFPLKEGYVTPGRLLAESGAVAAGAGVIGAAGYGGYRVLEGVFGDD
ncbi:DUF6531 domain-containing protein [Actinoplanes sp. NPDC024001]|uniref:DUF6531 domain-containing protein n=1 Tax=Actinoplanes sp. NPDC024001 TaxID=3154598 RepID=UPI0033DFE48B